MSELLNNLLEVYKTAKGGPEQAFVDKHTDNINTFDGPGVKEVKDAIDAVGYIKREPENHGYDSGKDEEVYEELEDIVNELMDELDEEEQQILEDLLIEEDGFDQIFEMIEEAKKCDEEDDEEDYEEDDEEDEEDDDEEDDEEDDGDIEEDVKRADINMEKFTKPDGSVGYRRVKKDIKVD